MTMGSMKRRELITLLGGAAVLWPGNGFGQTPPRRPLIGFLNNSSKAAVLPYYSSFPLGLRELGYIEGRDYALEERDADGSVSRLQLLAEELVSLKPDLIVAGSTPAALAAKRATASVPIVGLLMTDPVGMGLIKSEARPGTNVTGILIRVEGLSAKQLEIALDLVPGASKIGALINPDNPSNEVQRREADAAAAKLGVKLVPIEARIADEIGAAFQTFVRERASFVTVFSNATLRRQIAASALAVRMPTIYSDRESVESGGLISYGTNWREVYHRGAYYVDRILKGEKPADLPVEFPTKIELVVNLATAKAIGLAVPQALLARADEVIE
jgi:putative ABC transport system substrate-binding protein